MAKTDLTKLKGLSEQDRKQTVDHATKEIDRNFRELTDNADESIKDAYEATMRYIDTLPNSDYAIPEKTPVEEVRGTGYQADQSVIQQFGEGFVEGYGSMALDDDDE